MAITFYSFTNIPSNLVSAFNESLSVTILFATCYQAYEHSIVKKAKTQLHIDKVGSVAASTSKHRLRTT